MRGDRLSEIRVNRGLSRAELAEKCDLNEKQIWRYEKNAAQPTSGHLTKICQELAVSADYLLGLVDNASQTFVGFDLDKTERELVSKLRKNDVYELLSAIELIAGLASDIRLFNSI